MSSPFLLHLIHYIVCSVGIVSNSLVLFLVWRRTPSSLKSYSILIAFDAVVQLTTCFCSGVLFTRVVSVDDAALSIVSGPARLTGSPEFCFVLDSLMIFGYPHYSIMLVACFAFRYQVLTKSAPQVKTTVVFAVFLSLPTAVITVLYALTPLDTQENLRLKLLTKGADYDFTSMIIGPSDVTQPIIAIGLTYACLPSFPATIIVIYYARKIYRFLEENSIYMTEQMRNSQREIVTGLVIQACLPILYVIGIICYTMGQFNIVESYILEYSMNMFGEALVTICPIITIIFVQPYRRAAISLLFNSSGISSTSATELSLTSAVSKTSKGRSIVESILGVGYLCLLVVIAMSKLTVLKNPFYVIFVVTGIAAILNLIAIIALRLITSVFFLGPEFGPVCYCLSYSSHVFAFAHSVLKALQVFNRFTALFFPLRHDNIWASRAIWIIVAVSFISPAAIFSFMIIDQEALYIDGGGGRMIYVGINNLDRELAKILTTSIFGMFIVVTLPMNVMLLVKMFGLRRENITLFHKEKTYFVYVLVITLAHIISGAHQYAYPNTIITFTPPIVLILMSKPVRDGIRFSLTLHRSGTVVVDSTVSHKVTTIATA